MNKNKFKIFMCSVLVFLFAFSFNSRVVNAYFIDIPEEKVNTFTIAELKELVFQYFYIDDTDAQVQAKSSVTTKEFVGTQVNINDTLTNLDCNNIKHYINNNLYSSNTYTVVDDATIKEVCELNKYDVVIKSYTIDKDNNKVLVNTETKQLNKDRVVDLTTGEDSTIDYDNIKYYINNSELSSTSHTVTGNVEIERIYDLKEYNVIHKYSYIDETDQRKELQADVVEVYNKGDVINISSSISDIDSNSVSYEVNGSAYTGITYEVVGNDTIEEIYLLNRYTITYNLDGGTLANQKTTYTKMTETFSLGTPTKTGYSFTGWTGSNGTTPQTDVSINKDSTGDKEYTANWERGTFTVKFTGDTNTFSPNDDVTVLAGDSFEITVTLNWGYDVDGDPVVKMGGETLTQGADYTFTKNIANRSGTIKIDSVTGDVTIDVQTEWQWCLAEGTLVMLWDGSYKKIEDVTYNDLLKVWNHDTGTYGYEYPAWIEKAGTANVYTKVTFSDGSELKVVGNHSIFSKTHNKYVNINSDEFKVGDKVVNLKDGISYVTVTSIEEVEEEVKYYHVITNRYFNMITNDMLTTYEIYNNVSNYHGFGENLKWVKYPDSNELLSYEDMINQFGYVDRYLYKAFKMEDINYGLTNGLISVNDLNDLFNNYLMNNDRKVEPYKDNDGVRLWMVTTSDDRDPDDVSHQMRESSIYVVPAPKNSNGFKYWYNHSDNKYYNPGDMIEVDSSMYLEAIYE